MNQFRFNLCSSTCTVHSGIQAYFYCHGNCIATLLKTPTYYNRTTKYDHNSPKQVM